MTNSSSLVMMLLMFIGGGSLSTAGGIKVGTFAILVLSVLSFLRRTDEIRVFNHSVSHETTYKALAVTAITSILIFIGFFILLLLEPKADFMNFYLKWYRQPAQLDFLVVLHQIYTMVAYLS